MTNYSRHLNPSATPQSQPLPGREAEMVRNAAGGFTFKLDDWQRLRRFLILGVAEGGSYYEGERKLVIENATAIQSCLKIDGKRVVDLIVEVSDKGLAPKNDPAIFALAVATKFGDQATRHHAFRSVPAVCRIGTHLFQFAEAREAIGGGWGRGMRYAVGNWYLGRRDLVLQALKFQQRNGWSHADLLRLSHPQLPPEQVAGCKAFTFDAILKPEGGPRYAPGVKGKELVVRSQGGGWALLAANDRLVDGYLKIQKAETAQLAAKLIDECKLPREVVPTQFLKDPVVWEALLPHMGLGALVRNLGNLSKCGLLAPLSEAAKVVEAKITNLEQIKRARLHPFSVLVSSQVYASGQSVKGSGTWVAVPQVINALETTFYAAFQNVEPTGKRHLLAIDVSGSMTQRTGIGGLTANMCAAAMSMVTARTEPNYYTMGFATQFVDLKITAKDSLPDVMRKAQRPFGGTDTTVAIEWAKAHKIPVDVFVIYTDGETWAGNVHTSVALEGYRKAMGIPAKLAVVNFVAHGHTLTDPVDVGSMDFVGMDASMPQALAAFVTE